MEHLDLPLRLRNVAVVNVGVIDPDTGVAVRVLGAGEYVVSRLGPEVDPGVIVGGLDPAVLEVEIRWSGNVVDLVAERPCLHNHCLLHPRHSVDHE